MQQKYAAGVFDTIGQAGIASCVSNSIEQATEAIRRNSSITARCVQLRQRRVPSEVYMMKLANFVGELQSYCLADGGQW